MDTIEQILHAIIEVNKRKTATKQTMSVLIKQEAIISQEEAALLKKLLDYHKYDSKENEDDNIDDIDSDVVEYVKELTDTKVDTKTDTIPDDVSDTSTEPLSDDDDLDGFDRTELQNKSVSGIKRYLCIIV